MSSSPLRSTQPLAISRHSNGSATAPPTSPARAGGHNRWGSIVGLLATALWALSGCKGDQQVCMSDTPPKGWSSAQPIEVVYENEDPTTLRQIDLVARLNHNFGEDQLALRVETATPEGYRWRDTVWINTQHIAHCEGRFHREVTHPYRLGVLFSQKGKYLFLISALSPSGTVNGVAAVGVSITYPTRR